LTHLVLRRADVLANRQVGEYVAEEDVGELEAASDLKPGAVGS
jgi:hypothetical protein